MVLAYSGDTRPCPALEHVRTAPHRPSASFPLKPGEEYSVPGESQHKACVRGRQWLADRVAAANRSDAFHIDSPISENNFVSPERFQNIPKTFQIHSKYIPEAMLIPKIFLTQKKLQA